MDERVRCHQHAFHRGSHDFGARDAGTEGEVPAAFGFRGTHRCIFHVGACPRFRCCCHIDQGEADGLRRLRDHRPEDVADQRGFLDLGGSPGQDGRGRGEAAQQSDDDIDRETRRFRRGTPGPDHSGQAREDGVQGNRHHGDDLRRFRDRSRGGSRWHPWLGISAHDGRRRGRPGQRRRACLRNCPARFRTGCHLRQATRDFRQADRRASGHRVPDRRDGHQSRSGTSDDGQRCQAQGLG